MSMTFIEFWDWYLSKHDPCGIAMDPREVALAGWSRGVEQGYKKYEYPPRKKARAEIKRLRKALEYIVKTFHKPEELFEDEGDQLENIEYAARAALEPKE